MLIDTHTHLYNTVFQADGGGEAAVQRALQAGINHMIMPNVDVQSVSPMIALHKRFPTMTSVAFGLHPTEVNEQWRENIDQISNVAEEACVSPVAVGEIGMDLYWDKHYIDFQQQAFAYQLEMANDKGLPVIIHCRNALDPMLEVLSMYDGVRGVMHSFGGSLRDVERIRSDFDLYFGINGIVTFKNSNVHACLPAIGLERLLTETDSPYLSPVPMRGKRCESAYLVHTVRFIAEKMQVTYDDVCYNTTRNAINLFKIHEL